MKRTTHLLATALIPLLVAIAVACGGDDDPGDAPDPTATPAPSATATAPPAQPSPTPTQAPAATATPAPTDVPPSAPRPGADAAPQGTQTGIAEIDAILEDLLAGDPEALVGHFVLTDTVCTTAFGMGGPPKCDWFPGSPPDGTPVSAFPYGVCEGSWTSDVGPLVTELLTLDPQLFAVVSLEEPGPLFGEQGFPTVDHFVLVEGNSPNTDRQGVTLGIGDGAVVWLSYVCIGPPELMFGVFDPFEIILRGPAYQ